MTKEEVIVWIKSHSKNPRAIEQLEIYYKFLIQQNEVMNLTAIVDEDEVYLKHFYDSGLLIEHYSLTNKIVVDVGSGAGFPGIVLKILMPNFTLHIVEALEKRCRFLEQLIDLLALTDVKIIHNRAETYAWQHNEVYDLGICRAVSQLNIMLEIMVRMIKINGQMIFYKGPRWPEELSIAKTAMTILSLKNNATWLYQLPILGTRYLGVFQKTKSTSSKYPRNYSQIKKMPLD